MFVSLVVGSLAAAWLTSRLLRPVRRGSKSRALRDRWWLVGVTLAFVAVATPVPVPVVPMPASQLEMWRPIWFTVDTHFETGVRLDQLRAIASQGDADGKLAELLEREFSKLGPPRLESYRSAGELIEVGWRSRTRAEQSRFTFGWPECIASIALTRAQAPADAPHQFGKPPIAHFGWERASLHFNLGAWPGTWTSVHFSTLHAIHTAAMILILWWLVRTVLHSGLFFRRRRRAARGLCTACGYDLKGLRQS